MSARWLVRRAAATVAFGLLPATPFPTAAQTRVGLSQDSLSTVAGEVPEVPFGPGEELRYQLKYGFFGIGDARMSVPGIDTIHGRPVYVTELEIKGSVLGYGLEQRFYSWIDTEKLFSRRFGKDEKDRPREYEFFPEERRVHQIQHRDTTWTMPTSEPLDDLSFVYFARTLPLEVGETYEFNRYFKEDGNPVILKVLRKDERETKAGVFSTIVVQPIIPNSSLYSEGGNAEIHFSDDERRLVVYMKVDGPILPFNITMHLEEIR